MHIHKIILVYVYSPPWQNQGGCPTVTPPFTRVFTSLIHPYETSKCWCQICKKNCALLTSIYQSNDTFGLLIRLIMKGVEGCTHPTVLHRTKTYTPV